MTDLVLKRLDTAAELHAVYGLRVRAWRSVEESAIEGDRWSDPHDEHAIHWAVFEGDLIVAAARACIHERLDELPDGGFVAAAGEVPIRPPILVLSRLVVDPEKRRLGLAALLDEARLRFANEAGARSILGVVVDPIRIRALEARGFKKTLVTAEGRPAAVYVRTR